MDAARRENLRTKAKERWANSKIIAPKLCRSTEYVHNGYSKAKVGGPDQAMRAVKAAAAAVKELEKV